METGLDLHQLIRSMNRNEKGYFKKYARLYSGNHGPGYMKLFDAISAQQEYNEQRLLRKFKGQRFIKQFAVARSYLYDQVLRSLRSYHFKHRYSVRLNAYSDYADILLARGLYDQSGKQIRRLAEMSQEMDIPSRTIHSLEMLRRVAGFQPAQHRDAIFKKTVEEIKTLALRIAREQDMYQYYLDVFSRTQISLDKGEDVPPVQAPYTGNELQSIGFRSQMLYYTTETFQAYTRQDYVYAEECALRLLEIFEAHPAFLETAVVEYIGAVENYFACKRSSGRWEAFLRYDVKIRNLASRHRAAEKAALQFRSVVGGIELLGNHRYSEGVSFALQLERDLRRLGGMRNLAQEIYVMFNLCCCLFIGGETQKALRMANHTLNHYPADQRTDVHAALKLMLLMIHADRGNYDVVETQSRTARDFLKSRGFLGEAEDALLRSMLALASATEEKRPDIYAQMATTIPQKEKKVVFSGFEPEIWAAAHAENMSYAEMRRKMLP